MSAQIIPFDFEDQTVRIIMRGNDPWFVAADVCRIVGIANSRDAVSRLDDDEKGVGKTDTLGGSQQLTIISESGLYTLILRSNGATTPGTVQHRFRKWVTAEVLPTLRRTGRYEMPSARRAPAADADFAAELVAMSLNDRLAIVRETRHLFGRSAAKRTHRLVMPAPLVQAAEEPDDDSAGNVDALDCLAHVLSFRVAGRSVASMLDDPSAFAVLSELGLRMQSAGRLFIANSLPAGLFDGTPWAGNLHRAALLALPGAQPGPTLTLAGRRSRRVVAPLPASLAEVA